MPHLFHMTDSSEVVMTHSQKSTLHSWKEMRIVTKQESWFLEEGWGRACAYLHGMMWASKSQAEWLKLIVYARSFPLCPWHVN